MYVCVPCMYRYPWRPEKGTGSPRVTGSGKPLEGSARNWTPVLRKSDKYPYLLSFS